MKLNGLLGSPVISLIYCELAVIFTLISRADGCIGGDSPDLPPRGSTDGASEAAGKLISTVSLLKPAALALCLNVGGDVGGESATAGECGGILPPFCWQGDRQSGEYDPCGAPFQAGSFEGHHASLITYQSMRNIHP